MSWWLCHVEHNSSHYVSGHESCILIWESKGICWALPSPNRYEQEQAMVQEELLRLAKREREAANESLNVSLQRERNTTNEEKLKTAQLVSITKAFLGGSTHPLEYHSSSNSWGKDPNKHFLKCLAILSWTLTLIFYFLFSLQLSFICDTLFCSGFFFTCFYEILLMCFYSLQTV